MKKLSAAASAGILAFSLVWPGALSVRADDSPYQGYSGQGFQCETVVRDPDPVPYGNLGIQRGLRQNNPLSDAFRAGLNDFSMRTAALILKDSQENKNFSPVSLYYGLALAAQGAEGETKNQLLTLLQEPNGDLEHLSGECGRLYRLMYRNDECTRIKLSNSLWLQNGTPLKDAYKRAAENQYYASVFRVDFNSGNTPAIISSWTNNQMKGTLVSEPCSFPEENMRIVNSLIYSSQWVKSFEASGTVHAPFYLENGTETDCLYMTDQRNTSYYKGEGFIRASLSLTNNGTMIFILPDQDTDIQTLLSSEDTMKEMFGHVAGTYSSVSWKIPKFRFATSLKLKAPLETMGISDAFLPERAVFSVITSDSLFAGNVIQENVIGIDENGIETSSFSCPFMGELPVRTETPVEINLNRAFLYAVLIDPGVPLFIGTCRNPGNQQDLSTQDLLKQGPLPLSP